MNTKEKQLAGRMFRLSANAFANHGCNDLDLSLFNDWSEEEKKQLVMDFYRWNTHDEVLSDENFLIWNNLNYQ